MAAIKRPTRKWTRTRVSRAASLSGSLAPVTFGVMFQMNRQGTRILIAMAGIAILALLALAMLDSGHIVVPKWYKNTNRYKTRSLRASLGGIAEGFAKGAVLPPDNGQPVLVAEPDGWGLPVQYSYETDVPVIRAAGADGRLNTRDDVVLKVNITNDSRGIGASRAKP